jgi:hypothetical protein
MYRDRGVSCVRPFPLPLCPPRRLGYYAYRDRSTARLNRSSPSHQSSQPNFLKLFTYPTSLFFYFKSFYDNMSKMTYTEQPVAVASGNSLCEIYPRIHVTLRLSLTVQAASSSASANQPVANPPAQQVSGASTEDNAPRAPYRTPESSLLLVSITAMYIVPCAHHVGYQGPPRHRHARP